MEKYAPKRPVFTVQKFAGLSTVDDICELAQTDEYKLTKAKGTHPVMEIAGMTLIYGDALVLRPEGSLSVMTVRDLHNMLEVLP